MKSSIFNIFRTSLPLIAVLLFSCDNPQKEENKSSAQAEEIPFQKQVVEWSKDAVIYEMNIRQHTAEGTFNAAQTDLNRIAEMGADIIWLMPIHPIGELNRKGGKGSYYSVKDYKAVNPEFGTLDDFKAFVNAAHSLGLKVIIDWVANHTSFDNVWVENHKDWYTLDSTGNLMVPEGTDWSDVADLNFDNQEMRAAMLDALKFWITETDIDGYRCDVASWVPTDFWDNVRPELDAIKPVFMLAEAEETDLHENAFDMSYAWDFHHVTNKMAKGEKTISDLKSYYEAEKQKFRDEDYRMVFTTNHDENSWNGTMDERYGKAVKPYNVLTFTLFGMPLLYSGQEGGETKRLAFFEKDTVDWNDYALEAFYTKLIKLKKDNQALWNGMYGGSVEFMETNNENVLAFYRNKDSNTVVVIINFSDKKQNITISQGDGSMNAKEIFTGEEVMLENPATFKLEAYGFKVFQSID